MTKETYTITKTLVECYKLRHNSGMYWADITIDAKEGTGRIQIASDFGSWQNSWGACGCPFKEFLTKIDMDYFAGKVGESHWFDSEKTIQNWKNQIIEEFDSGNITEQDKEDLFIEIEGLGDYIHEAEFSGIVMQMKPLMKFFDYMPDLHRDISPRFRKFWETVWPVFIEALKQEINLTPTTE